MTNLEKYKTAQDREMAFRWFCKAHHCEACPLSDFRGSSEFCPLHYGCVLKWLEMEAEEELLPCPFCGGKASAVDSGVSIAAHVRCDNCHSSSGDYDTKEEAIAAWNRRAK